MYPATALKINKFRQLFQLKNFQTCNKRLAIAYTLKSPNLQRSKMYKSIQAPLNSIISIITEDSH